MKENTISYAEVEFKKRGGRYQGSVPLKDLPFLQNDPAQTMHTVTDIYRSALREITQWQRDVQILKSTKIPIPARKAWQLGDILHKLNIRTMEHGCRIQSIYDHLQRHAGIPPKRATEFVTFRRYVEDVNAIPENLNWNRICKTVKTTGMSIAAGLPVEV